MADKNTHTAKQPESYKKIKTLGQGAQGTAYLVQAESDRSFAVIKKIDLTKMSEDERKTAYREVKMLELFNHAGIIRFREVYKNKQGKLCIVMDFADGKLFGFNFCRR